MTLGDVMLLVAFVVTAAHAILDLVLVFAHVRHPKALKGLTVASVGFMLAHVVLTGEAAEWVGLLLP